jgi:hypothetical protein
MKRYFLTFLFVITFSTSYADETWQCITEDAQHHFWSAEHTFSKKAKYLSLDACKKMSKFPRSCAIIQSGCDLLEGGVSTRPYWVCTALDSFSNVFKNEPVPHKDSAILQAKLLCNRNSKVSDSCYVNPITCKNINDEQ